MGLDPVLKNGIDQRARRDDSQAVRLYRAHRVGVGKQGADRTEQLLARHAAHRSPDGQRSAGFQIHPAVARKEISPHRVAAHGQHGASGQKADGGNAGQGAQVQYGLDDNTAILDPAKLQFGYEDFVFVENLYSSIFVLSADAKLNIKSIADLEAYAAGASEISVAVNGATGSEAFLAAALFGKMGAGDKLKLTPYQSAAEAAQAVSKGETQFAVSHQSQILEAYQQNNVTVVCAFDQDAIANGPFTGVEGVGAKGYPYFRNRCFIMARAGTDASAVAELKELYGKILGDQEVADWLHDTMLLEVDTMSVADVEAHIQNVKDIVNQYKDIVQS